MALPRKIGITAQMESKYKKGPVTQLKRVLDYESSRRGFESLQGLPLLTMKNNITAKICSTCEQEKCIDEFTKRKSAIDGHNASCQTCTQLRTKLHYENNKAYYAAKNKRRKEESRRKLNEYKEGLKCKVCGESRPQCLDFHHKDRKTETIANVHHRGWSWERVLKEIKKCIVLCSNCHRTVHWEERQK